MFTTQPLEMTAGPRNQPIFKYMAPVNLCLAAIISYQNSLIIWDFYADRRRLSALMFILIAAADIVSAAMEVARGTVALTCLRDHHSKVPGFLVLSYLCLGVFSYNCSVFFNLVLTMVKTIHISRPFYHLNSRAIKTALFLVPLLSLIITVADVVCWHYAIRDHRHCLLQFLLIDAVSYIGEGVLVTVLRGVKNQRIGGGVLLYTQYLVPCVIVLVCMCIQVHYIRKMNTAAPDVESRLSVNRANFTILLVSLSFAICTCAYPIIFSLEHSPHFPGHSDRMFKRFAMIMKCTLPLINAVIFLFVLVVRRETLRRKNWEIVGRVFNCPGMTYQKIKTFYYSI